MQTIPREMAIQFGTIGLASVIVVAVTLLSPEILLASPWGVLVVAAAYVIAVGGSHVYLAIRGDGTTVPVTARWRFVAVLVLLAGLWVIAMIAEDVNLPAEFVSWLTGVAAVLVFAAYFVYEVAAGYRQWKTHS